MKDPNEWRKAGFASPAAYRDAEFGLDVLAVFLGAGAIGAIICWAARGFGWL